MAQVLILKTQTDLIKVQSKRQELKLFQTNQIYTKIHVVRVFQSQRLSQIILSGKILI